jgi:hypothetical protein
MTPNKFAPAVLVPLSHGKYRDRGLYHLGGPGRRGGSGEVRPFDPWLSSKKARLRVLQFTDGAPLNQAICVTATCASA